MRILLHYIYERFKALQPGEKGRTMNFDKNDVALAMNNHKEAFEKIYKSIYMDLYKMAFYIMGNSEHARDIVSETILDAYTGITKLKDPVRFEQWILKILTIKCKKKMKEKYSKITIFNSKVSSIDDYQIKDLGVTYDNEVKTDVQIAISRLNKEERTIISLCIVEGYKSNEVSEILNMNPSTVRSKLNRALAKMKKYLEVK